ncbi:MAG TPA: PEP-CTERM sorting domain-containing protein [Vicinamibacterales bacterium]
MKVRATVLALTLTVVGASTAWAAAITINSNAGTTYTTAGINDFSAHSSQMNGMEITARWTVNGAGYSQTEVWNGGVNFTGLNFGLTVDGNTINSNAWELDFNVWGNGRLESLEFNGVPGNTVFDRTLNGDVGTVGSSLGRDFAGFDWYGECRLLIFCTPGQITATYFNQVILGANDAAGDLFAGFKVDFNSFGGLGWGNNWRFSLDTDIATTRLVVPDTKVEDVPEPVSLLLLGTGLFGLAAARRRAARRS